MGNYCLHRKLGLSTLVSPASECLLDHPRVLLAGGQSLLFKKNKSAFSDRSHQSIQTLLVIVSNYIEGELGCLEEQELPHYPKFLSCTCRLSFSRAAIYNPSLKKRFCDCFINETTFNVSKGSVCFFWTTCIIWYSDKRLKFTQYIQVTIKTFLNYLRYWNHTIWPSLTEVILNCIKSLN